jgi:hypothetical protein
MGIPGLYPLVSKIIRPNEQGKGPFANGKPIGATIYALDACDVDAALADTERGYHLFVDRAGAAVQTCYFSQRVDHPDEQHISVCMLRHGDESRQLETLRAVLSWAVALGLDAKSIIARDPMLSLWLEKERASL